MPAMLRPRRSVLYMPGANPRALEKARTLPADGLILDLEDAVAPEAKAAARGRVVEAVRAGGYGRREVLIRVNGLATAWGREDLLAAAAAGADGVVLPKVESSAAVREARAVLREAGAPDELPLWCMIETPRGVLAAAAIAAGPPAPGGLIMGTSDLAKELRAAPSVGREPLITALGLCLLAARAHDLPLLDGVHLDLQDAAGLDRACAQGAAMGFDGKTLIHPRQIEVANRAFAPAPEEIAQAERIVEAHEAAAREGRGIVVVDGRLIESLHVAEAKRRLALAEMISGMAGAEPG